VPAGWEFVLRQPFEGVSYIAAVLHNSGYPVKIIDVRFGPDPVRAALEQAADVDALGIATYEDGFPFIEELARRFKESRPSAPVILGGSLVTSAPETMLKHTAADLAVLGEGEAAILELMDLLAAGAPGRINEIAGLCYKDKDGRLVFTPARAQMPDLSALPLMDLSLWPSVRKDPKVRELLFSHSRGCYRDCSFCFRTTPKLSYKSVGQVRAELAELKKRHDFEFIYFVDLTWAIEKRRALELCAAIEPLRVKWSCMTRVQHLDAEILSAMKRAGCEIILYGFESLDQAVLDGAKKGTSEKEIRQAIRMTRAAGIRVGGLFIVGLPGESVRSLEKLLEFTRETGDVTRVKYLSAIPGTGVYRAALETGAIKSELEHLRWLSREKGQPDDEFLNLSGLPDETLRAYYNEISALYQAGPRPGPKPDFF
jgi:radical SAM superfamily enzyme YgiQ (UPF0313 family)